MSPLFSRAHPWIPEVLEDFSDLTADDIQACFAFGADRHRVALDEVPKVGFNSGNHFYCFYGMRLRLIQFLWSWLEPVYIETSSSSRKRLAALCRFRHWNLLVECFEERATPMGPRQVEWWSHGRTQESGVLHLRCGTWRWAVRYLTFVLRGRYPWPDSEEPSGSAPVVLPRGPRGPVGLPPAMELPFDSPETS